MDPAERLQAEHDRLCFLRAFPASARELRRAERELAGFERRALRRRDDLFNSGIAGTRYFYPWNFRMARWLSDRYGRAKGRGRGTDLAWLRRLADAQRPLAKVPR